MDSLDPDEFVEVRDSRGTLFRIPAAVLNAFAVAVDDHGKTLSVVARLEKSFSQLGADEAAKARRAARDLLKRAGRTSERRNR